MAQPRRHAITQRVLMAFARRERMTVNQLAAALDIPSKYARQLITRYTARGLLGETGEVVNREKVRCITIAGALLLGAPRAPRPPTKAERQGRYRRLGPNSVFDVDVQYSRYKF